VATKLQVTHFDEKTGTLKDNVTWKNMSSQFTALEKDIDMGLSCATPLRLGVHLFASLVRPLSLSPITLQASTITIESSGITLTH
jgi:hypothetical protein